MLVDPGWILDRLHAPKESIVPLSSNALAMRYDRLAPGPELAMRRPEREATQAELLEVPSVVERRLRHRLGEMVATQAVEDEAGMAGPRAAAGPGLYHRYNAALKRVMGDKARSAMTLAELEAAIGWMERNRLADHLHLLDDDPRYAWSARRRGAWTPPVGRSPGRRSSTAKA